MVYQAVWNKSTKIGRWKGGWGWKVGVGRWEAGEYEDKDSDEWEIWYTNPGTSSILPTDGWIHFDDGEYQFAENHVCVIV